MESIFVPFVPYVPVSTSEPLTTSFPSVSPPPSPNRGLPPRVSRRGHRITVAPIVRPIKLTTVHTRGLPATPIIPTIPILPTSVPIHMV